MTAELHTDLGWSTATSITVRNQDLCADLMGKVNLGDMAWLELTGRLPNPQESTVFNAILVTLVEHGITPSALATRLTYLGAPESVQGAVAAGLLGLGTVLAGTMDEAARYLQEALGDPASVDADLRPLAAEIVRRHRTQKRLIAGLGHPIHKPIDPRTPRLFQIARENGYAGRYIALMELVGEEAESAFKRPLPVNATGAIAAVASELGLSWTICRGLAVMGRAIGLVAHVLEESQRPMAAEVWQQTEEQATREHRA